MEETYKRSSVNCNPHPDAPHKFLKDASNSEGRYVCQCEFWAGPNFELTDEDALRWYKSLNKKDLSKISIKPMQRQVIDMFYGCHGTQKQTAKEIATHYDLSLTRIYDLRNSGLRRLYVNLNYLIDKYVAHKPVIFHTGGAVAWMNLKTKIITKVPTTLDNMMPLYVHPKKAWVGLDDEEVHQAFCHAEYETNHDWNDDPESWCKAFYRYVEERLKEKNGG